MDIVVKGRNVEVPEHYRRHVTGKLERALRFDRKIIEIDVELLHERNPRQQGQCQRVEITCISRGPVVRAEACGRDFYTALDEAITKLNTRLRRAADRRRVHRRRRAPTPVPAATGDLPADLPAPAPAQRAESELGPELGSELGPELGVAAQAVAQAEYDDQPWHIVREKEHPGDPMTVEDALFHMELVGHDFFLFNDKESGRPSVVYRRRGYDYGVITLADPAR